MSGGRAYVRVGPPPETSGAVQIRTRGGIRQKRCVGCHRWLDAEGPTREFHGDPKLALGCRNQCRMCRRDQRPSQSKQRKRVRLFVPGDTSDDEVCFYDSARKQ